jgi:hypothetical protein
MCILCEPKYVKDSYGEDVIKVVANKIIYHDDRIGPGLYPWEVTNEPAYEDCWGGFYIDNGNELNAVADDPHCSAGPLTIKYCPICGRPLEHKE